MFSGVSNIVNEVDTAFLVILGISFALFALVVVLMVAFVIKYHKKRHPQSVQIEDNALLEFVWTLIPLVIVGIMFWYGWAGYTKMVNVPTDAFKINVYGQMWEWSFEYPNNKKTKELFVPVDKPIKLLLHSRDVLHGFSVPAFRIKQDAVPGMETMVWFNAYKTGDYQIFCTQYCGLKHSSMLSKIHVMEDGAFKDWYEQNLK